MTEKPADEKKEGEEWKLAEPTAPEPSEPEPESVEARLTQLESQIKSLLTQPAAAPTPETKVEKVDSLEVKATPAPIVETPVETANLPQKRKRKKLRLW